MTERRRKLILTVFDGHMPAIHFLNHFDRFTRCEQILLWFISNEITGKKFCEWLMHEHKGRCLAAGQWVLSQIDGGDIKPLIARKDYLVSI